MILSYVSLSNETISDLALVHHGLSLYVLLSFLECMTKKPETYELNGKLPFCYGYKFLTRYGEGKELYFSMFLR